MFEAYKIGISLTLVNHATSGLLSLSRDFARTEASAAALEKRISSIHGHLMRGQIMTAAGTGMLRMLKGPLEEAKKFQTEIARFSAMGLGDKTTQEAIKVAKSMDIMGQSATDNMKLLRESVAIMGDLDHATQAAPLLAKMKFGIESVMGDGHGGKFERMFQDAIKVTELRGALTNRETGHIDLKRFEDAINKMTQAYVASGGTVTPSQYLAAIKTGGVSTKLMSDEMFYFGLGHFMQESGGSRTGTASMSLFQNLAMGRMPAHIAENLDKYGLLNKSMVEYKDKKSGDIKRVAPMGIVNAEKFVENPFKWVNEEIVPRLKAQGLKGNALNTALATLMGQRTSANLADQMVRDQVVTERYMERSKKAVGVQGLYDLGSQTLTGKEMQLQAKWKDLMRELGTTVLPLAIKGVEALIKIIRPISKLVESHPEAAKLFVLSLVTLAGALVVGGIASNVLAIIGLVRLLGSAGLAAAAAAGLGGAGAAAAGAAGAANAAGTAGVVGGAAGAAGSRLAMAGRAGVIGLWGYMMYEQYTRAAKLWDDHKEKQRVEGMKAPSATNGNINISLKLDGKTVANVVTDHQGRELSRPDAGTSRPDYSHSRPLPAGGYSK